MNPEYEDRNEACRFHARCGGMEATEAENEEARRAGFVAAVHSALCKQDVRG